MIRPLLALKMSARIVSVITVGREGRASQQQATAEFTLCSVANAHCSDLQLLSFHVKTWIKAEG